MNFLKNMFGKKPTESSSSIKTNADFWDWFQANAQRFKAVVKSGKNIEPDFFEPLSKKLGQLRDGYFFLTGMMSDDTAELVLTADGAIKNIVFVEELVAQAPAIDGWKITALKAALDNDDAGIAMNGVKFDMDNMHFYANELENYPDEVDITLVHTDFNEDQKDLYTNGAFIFMDNYLGELKAATQIDYAKVTGPQESRELIPLKKLSEYLNWREKEFIEQYEGVRYNTEEDTYFSMEATLKSGAPLIATINGDLMKWDKKASHPWISSITLEFEPKNESGFPTKEDYETLNELEDELLEDLKDSDGYLNVGRETAEGIRTIFIASKEFRKISKAISAFQVEHGNKFKINHKLYKDKYWRSLNFYMPQE